MRRGTFRPRARTEGLTVQELDGELLAYDRQRDKVHCLNGAAARVWAHCDGKRSITELAGLAVDTRDRAVGREVVRLALKQLGERHLLDEASPDAVARVSRRQVLRKIAWAGAAGLSLPVIKSLLAPTAAQAGSCVETGKKCKDHKACCSGYCLDGYCADPPAPLPPSGINTYDGQDLLLPPQV